MIHVLTVMASSCKVSVCLNMNNKCKMTIIITTRISYIIFMFTNNSPSKLCLSVHWINLPSAKSELTEHRTITLNRKPATSKMHSCNIIMISKTKDFVLFFLIFSPVALLTEIVLVVCLAWWWQWRDPISTCQTRSE